VVFLRDVLRGVGVVDGPELDAGVLVHEVVEALATDRGGRDDPVPVRELAGARDDAPLDQVDETLCEQLGVHTKVGMIPEHAEDLVRQHAYPDLQRRAVRDALGDVLQEPIVYLAHRAGREFREGIVGLAPACDLADVHLVLAEGPRHLVVDLEKQGHLPDHGRHVLGVGTQREVTVAVWR
jgi:hypothetical protein